MKFRLTIGENGTKWGKQRVVYSGKAKNAVAFIRNYAESSPDEWVALLKDCWVDAGPGTIPVAVENLVW